MADAQGVTRIYNMRPSPPDVRDYLAKAEHYGAVPTQATVTHIPSPRDQGQEGSCFGFCGTNARMVYLMAAGKSDVLSAAYLYYIARAAMGDTADDTGSDMRTGLDAAVKQGLAPESLMPYSAGAWRVAPSAAAVAAASQFAIAAYGRVTDMQTIKAAIASDHPVLFGITVWQGFESAGADGIVPMWSVGEQPLGGHAILCVGYKDDPSVPGGGHFQLLNSWGPNAGDRGFYYIPYAYLNLAAGATGQMLSEAWVIDVPTAAPTQGYVDPVTGLAISGPFLDYYTAKGGLPILGRPITVQGASTLTVDKGRVVQYFEHNRLELWPENPPGWTVLGSSFGAMVAKRLGFAGPGIDGVTDIIPNTTKGADDVAAVAAQ